MGELTERRFQIFKELKPVFVKFYNEKGHYPTTLQELVPDYMEAIPGELLNDKMDFPAKEIYYMEGDQPGFLFHTHCGPDSAASYCIITGEYWHAE